MIHDDDLRYMAQRAFMFWERALACEVVRPADWDRGIDAHYVYSGDPKPAPAYGTMTPPVVPNDMTGDEVAEASMEGALDPVEYRPDLWFFGTATSDSAHVEPWESPDDRAVLFPPPYGPGPEGSPIADILPALAAGAYLTVAPKRDVEAPRKPHWIMMTDPSGMTHGPLSALQQRRYEALWTLDVVTVESQPLEWRDDSEVVITIPTGRPKSLRRAAIERLTEAWGEDVERMRMALRWFYPPDLLTHSIVKKIVYDAL